MRSEKTVVSVSELMMAAVKFKYFLYEIKFTSYEIQILHSKDMPYLPGTWFQIRFELK